jgi:hypothetical protein
MSVFLVAATELAIHLAADVGEHALTRAYRRCPGVVATVHRLVMKGFGYE